MLRLIPNQAASDIKTPGKYTENITVTYPDGSQDNIDTNVFADEKPKTTTIEAAFSKDSDASKITNTVNTAADLTLGDAKTKAEGTAIHNVVSSLSDPASLVDIANLTKDNNSEVSNVTWKDDQTPSVATTGKRNTTATIHFIDGSTLDVPVSYTVTASQADNCQPITKQVSTDKSTTPDAPSAVTNKDTDKVDPDVTKLPASTKLEWNDPDKIGDDVKTPGKKTDENLPR